MAVQVIVKPRPADWPSTGTEARLLRRVDEPITRCVLVQNPAVEASDEQVYEAVVVVVGGCGARAVSAPLQCHLLRDICEPHASFVPVHAVPEFRRVLFQRRYRRPVREEDVRQSVAIGIECGHPARHCLD